jgi:hypothetical protein
MKSKGKTGFPDDGPEYKVERTTCKRCGEVLEKVVLALPDGTAAEEVVSFGASVAVVWVLLCGLGVHLYAACKLWGWVVNGER